MKKKTYYKELRKQGITNFRRTLILKDRYGTYCNKPLSLQCVGTFRGAEIVAYPVWTLNWMYGRTRKGKETIDVGDVKYATVNFPICCKIGGVFSAEYYYGHTDYPYIATLKLLKIKKHKGRYALVKVKVLFVGNPISWVKTISEEKKLEIASMPYDELLKIDDASYVSCECIGSRKFYEVRWTDYGGDEYYSELIYMDDDGIDHLVHSDYTCFEDDQSFYGDRILGIHESGPFYKMEEFKSYLHSNEE